MSQIHSFLDEKNLNAGYIFQRPIISKSARRKVPSLNAVNMSTLRSIDMAQFEIQSSKIDVTILFKVHHKFTMAFLGHCAKNIVM